MPYGEHPAVTTPDQDTLRIWRFMDFTKFVSLLEESALFFATLSTFTDPLEGYLSKPTVEKISLVPEGLSDEDRRRWELAVRSHVHFYRCGREYVLVSCWHLNEYESAAMWGLHVKRGEGVAVRSTIGRMKRAFEAESEVVYIGKVNYVDYAEEEVPTGNILYLPQHKRKSFEHEHELRAMICAVGEATSGKLVMVDLNELVERVFVAPNSPVWVHQLVKKVLLRYRLDAEVVHSALEEKPLY